MDKTSLGRFGVFENHTRITPEFGAEIEQFGYGTVWLAGSPSADLQVVEDMLDATDHIVVATGIVNIWVAEAQDVARSWQRIENKHPGRFVLGIGAGHPERHAVAAKPYSALSEYLDVLDEGGVPQDRRLLAALGPRVLRLSASRTLGAHPYLVTPQHTSEARTILGPNALLAPAHNAIITTDIDEARSIGRPVVANPYLNLVNYRSNFLREGFTEEDLDNDGSDRVVDAMVFSGSAEDVAEKLSAHHAAGADHVGVQMHARPGEDKITGYRQLAQALGLS